MGFIPHPLPVGRVGVDWVLFQPNLERAILRQVKEAKESRGGVGLYAAQVIAPADAELAENGSSRRRYLIISNH